MHSKVIELRFNITWNKPGLQQIFYNIRIIDLDYSYYDL